MVYVAMDYVTVYYGWRSKSWAGLAMFESCYRIPRVSIRSCSFSQEFALFGFIYFNFWSFVFNFQQFCHFWHRLDRINWSCRGPPLEVSNLQGGPPWRMLCYVCGVCSHKWLACQSHMCIYVKMTQLHTMVTTVVFVHFWTTVLYIIILYTALV